MSSKKVRTEITGNRILSALNERNMSRQELIEILNYDASYMAKIINNKYKFLSVSPMVEISRVLGYPIEALFTFSQPKNARNKKS